MNKNKSKPGELAKNKKAYHNYEILDTFEAGIQLLGTEIKSLRNHGGSLLDAYIIIIKNEMWLLNSSITPYKFGNLHNHKDRRERKLLMHKNEIRKLNISIKEKSLSLIPLSFYLKNGIVKVKIALAKGLKKYDKRQKIIEKEEKRKIKNL